MKVFRKIFNFYYDSFRSINKLGVRLIIIIMIKLFIMFVILKILFFPDFLVSKFKNDKQKSEYILDQLTK